MILPIIYLFLGFFIKELFFDNFIIYCHTYIMG
jgi:hypothetical protein